MRLKAIAKSGESKGESRELLAMPIDVEELGIEGTTFHSDTMIASVGFDHLIECKRTGRRRCEPIRRPENRHQLERDAE